MTDPATTPDPQRAAIDAAIARTLADVEPPDLRAAALHLPVAGGKRLRPRVALLACEAAGGRASDAMPLAVALELVHVFSLVHDDIMDEDRLRRGQPTVHVRWGQPVAILAGDVLHAKAFEVLATAPLAPERVAGTLAEVAETVRVLCEGQALDMAFERRAPADVSEGDYLHMVYGKTARLFEAAARGGALVAGARRADVEALGAYGRALGLAFQIQDDLLGLTQTTEALGKPALSDLRRAKKTLPAILAFRRAEGKTREALQACFGTADGAATALEAIRATGAIEESRRRVEELAREGRNALTQLGPSPAREALEEFVRMAAQRSA